jgi:hypothetical protein
VGDAHGVEDAAAVAWCSEVGVAVEVGKPGVGFGPLEAGEHAEGDRAVAAEHDEDRAGVRRPLDRVRDGAGRSRGGGFVAGRRARPIGPEGLAHDVAEAGHLQPGRRQAVDEAARPQRVRSAFLAGVVSAGAGGRAQDTH